MQISTSLLFDRASAQMSAVQNSVAKSQAQISEQKQVLNPSDAPDQAAVITRLKSLIGRQDSYSNTLDAVQAHLDQENSTLSSAGDILVRIKELNIQANNATIGASTRTVIANEMQGLRDQLLSLANTTDTTGNYIFSGSKVHTPAFEPDSTGVVQYQGDQTAMSVAVGENRIVNVNRPGTKAFVSVVRTNVDGSKTGVGFFQSIDDLIAGVKAGDAKALQRGLTEMDALHQASCWARRMPEPPCKWCSNRAQRWTIPSCL